MEAGPDDQEMAKAWLVFGINRKITKRQVMVVPYAGTFASCMEYTREAVKDKLKEGVMAPWGDQDPNPWIVYLSKLIWEAIDLTVVKGKEAMRWLSKSASEYTRWANKLEGTAYDKRMSWVTPDGFEAIHYRASEKQRRVETYLDGRVNLAYHEPTMKLEGRDMALAVAPNFVHSYDACLLRMSVVKGLDLGITHFGMVHDSFGVHACDMARFVQGCIKPAFIDMYQENALAKFEGRLPDEVRVGIDPVPEMGTLDINGVLENEFFFS
jgi:DNA-directed RNA polymerase